MRAIALLTCLLLLTLTVPAADAIPPVCTSQTVDAGVVKVTVGYGGGIGCLDAGVERCTLRHDPEHPGHPTWHCERVV